MSRAEGFLLMDVSTNIHDDPKFRTLWRRHGPEMWLRAFALYTGMMAESWKTGQPVDPESGCPVLLSLDPDELAAVVAAMVEVGLLDGEPPTIPAKTWSAFYLPAKERRDRRRQSGFIGGSVTHGRTREEAEAAARRRWPK